MSIPYRYGTTDMSLLGNILWFVCQFLMGMVLRYYNSIYYIYILILSSKHSKFNLFLLKSRSGIFYLSPENIIVSTFSKSYIFLSFLDRLFHFYILNIINTFYKVSNSSHILKIIIHLSILSLNLTRFYDLNLRTYWEVCFPTIV